MNSSTPESSFEKLKKETKTLHLSSLTNEGKPNASYAPFVTDNKGCFYIFISGLASHTQDLLSNPIASILLIRDEQDSKQIFARQRASYQCDVEIVDRESADFNVILDQMEDRFGNVVTLLKGLSDFILFRFRPYQGQFVMGFGKAYKLKGDGLLELEHIDPSAE